MFGGHKNLQMETKKNKYNLSIQCVNWRRTDVVVSRLKSMIVCMFYWCFFLDLYVDNAFIACFISIIVFVFNRLRLLSVLRALEIIIGQCSVVLFSHDMADDLSFDMELNAGNQFHIKLSPVKLKIQCINIHFFSSFIWF